MAKSKTALIQEIASKHNLPLSTVAKVVDHQFKYVAKVMKEGKFESVRLPYFGKFSVNPNRVQRLNEKQNGTDNNQG